MSKSKSETIKQEIRNRLWYSLDDIDMASNEMDRAVESIYNLIVYQILEDNN